MVFLAFRRPPGEVRANAGPNGRDDVDVDGRPAQGRPRQARPPAPCGAYTTVSPSAGEGGRVTRPPAAPGTRRPRDDDRPRASELEAAVATVRDATVSPFLPRPAGRPRVAGVAVVSPTGHGVVDSPVHPVTPPRLPLVGVGVVPSVAPRPFHGRLVDLFLVDPGQAPVAVALVEVSGPVETDNALPGRRHAAGLPPVDGPVPEVEEPVVVETGLSPSPADRRRRVVATPSPFAADRVPRRGRHTGGAATPLDATVRDHGPTLVGRASLALARPADAPGVGVHILLPAVADRQGVEMARPEEATLATDGRPFLAADTALRARPARQAAPEVATPEDGRPRPTSDGVTDLGDAARVSDTLVLGPAPTFSGAIPPGETPPRRRRDVVGAVPFVRPTGDDVGVGLGAGPPKKPLAARRVQLSPVPLPF